MSWSTECILLDFSTKVRFFFIYCHSVDPNQTALSREPVLPQLHQDTLEQALTIYLINLQYESFKSKSPKTRVTAVRE